MASSLYRLPTMMSLSGCVGSILLGPEGPGEVVLQGHQGNAAGANIGARAQAIRAEDVATEIICHPNRAIDAQTSGGVVDRPVHGIAGHVEDHLSNAFAQGPPPQHIGVGCLHCAGKDQTEYRYKRSQNELPFST